jgi:hypothetical protein
MERTMKIRVWMTAAVVLIAGASSSRAQAIAKLDSSTTAVTSDSAVTTYPATTSSIDMGPAAVRRTTTPRSLDAAMAATHQGMGEAKALMIVGAAGFVAGALIGGDSGKIIMVGSAVVGLYGLYQYLQ